MATTDAKAGFRLPWSSDRSSTDSPDTEHLENVEAIAQPNEPAASAGWPSNGTATHDVTRPSESPVATDENDETAETPTEQTAETEAEPFMVETESATEPATAARFHSGKKPSKFLADLTKAMQTAAEDARSLALSQLQAEAKNHVEQIHARSSTEAADLRRVADDDVASVREWSKAEIARIREETEAKISERKGRLETEVEQHAAVIEHEIEAVQSTVAGFEADMASFFERLLAEEDPTQFATMAERLPEPPSFEGLFAAPAEPEAETVADEPTAEIVTDEAVEAEAQTSETEATEAETETDAPASEGEVELIGDTPSGDEMIGDTPTGEEMIGEYGSYDGEGADGEVDREAAFAAIQAAAEAAASAEVAADAAARAEAVADVAIEIIGSHGEDGEAEAEADPRVTALGLSPDYDAAEAEALASANPADGEEIPEINDDALAARLAGLVPNRSSRGASTDATATQVIVVGLVSVASIASFKRHLGRLSGVQSVGVSSGPDGEFVFAVNHTAEIVLREAIPSLPSFQARVTSTSDGVVHVTAHDPESDN
jgi:hypothetical protein